MKNISETGRSMVEMLGVLAIVGVLSVGSISGYGKAMNMITINNTVREIVIIINEVLLYRTSLIQNGSSTQTSVDVSSIVTLPTGWSQKQINKNTSYVYDAQGGYFNMFIGKTSATGGKDLVLGIDYFLGGRAPKDLCVTYLQDIILHNKDNLAVIGTYASGRNYITKYYKTPTKKSEKSFDDLTMSALQSACSECAGLINKQCRVYAHFTL